MRNNVRFVFRVKFVDLIEKIIIGTVHALNKTSSSPVRRPPLSMIFFSRKTDQGRPDCSNLDITDSGLVRIFTVDFNFAGKVARFKLFGLPF